MKKLLTLLSLIPTLLFGQTTPNINQVLGAGSNATNKPLTGLTLVGLKGSTSGTVTVNGPAIITTYTFTLPANDGTSGQVLQTDGSGVTSWQTVSSGLTVGTTAIASGTVGALLFEGATNVLQEDATQLFWDNTTNYLGVGSTTITATLGVRGESSSDATKHSLKIQDNLSNPMLYANNNRQISLNTADAYMILNVFGGGLFGGVGSVAPTSGSSVAAIGLRVGNSDFFGTSACLDFGSNGSTYSWMQSTLSTDYANRYPLLINPNGGFVGVGLAAVPSAALHVKGSTSDISAKSFLAENAAGTDYFGIYNAGQFYAGDAGDNIFFGENSGLLISGNLSSTTIFNTAFGTNSLAALTTGNYNSAFGDKALTTLTSTSYNTAFGYSALTLCLTGEWNTAVGADALNKNTTGSRNTAVGLGALFSNTTGVENTAFGDEALFNLAGANHDNVAVGYKSLYLSTAGNNNTAIGVEALSSYATTDAGGVALGYRAGLYETASNKLYIDNTGRASEAAGRLEALIYGVFDASVANQRLSVNGIVLPNAATTTVSNSGSGTTEFAQPFGGTALKKVAIYINNATGTASYTYPVAFTYTPGIVITSAVAAAVVTTLSATAVTITGAATTGFIFLEGY